MTSGGEPSSVPADPSKWSEKSQRSVSVEWVKEYTSYRYSCWRCRQSAVFTASEQKYAYEVKKTDINQKRLLCTPCWQRRNDINGELRGYEHVWSESKPAKARDPAFLASWLALLNELEEYVPYRADTARKNMLAKLLSEA
jgi:Probable zinc-ribbon domain